ncbi:MAG TPA: DmsC/YnfH family molybdoenzyme membrane anchor subunit [Usitatibacter sp.]|nr:DmsC/YnfH family molybdoenzyme membrane anchor subunit [Usitatibacter sp.]
MQPALSVVFLTTLIGAGQGLFLALYGAELAAGPGSDARFFVTGAAFSLALCALGLVASFFHLGRPERAWRTATRWRTSWLSREVVALPVFMALVAAYGALRYAGSAWALPAGALAVLACIALFVCTSMIYASIRFLQEWASPYTLPNFFLMGCASGLTLAVALAAAQAPALAWPCAIAAVAASLAALAVRLASLARNDRLRPKSTLQSAIGIANPRIRQKSQGFTASSFNTREFFHGVSPEGMRAVRVAFIQMAFIVPVLLVLGGMKANSPGMLAAAFGLQYAGLVVERWYFLAQSSHPQNLYYQARA